MDFVNYKQKLREFNSTEKYISELEYLCGLCALKTTQKALDYGCGLGTAMKYISEKSGCEVYGYDVHSNYYDGEPFYFRTEMYFPVDVVYFMHSFAHIPNPTKILDGVFSHFLKPHGKIIIITPNKSWIDKNKKQNYIPDATVVEHYSINKLMQMVGDSGFKITRAGGFGMETNGEHERLFIVAQS